MEAGTFSVCSFLDPLEAVHIIATEIWCSSIILSFHIPRSPKLASLEAFSTENFDGFYDFFILSSTDFSEVPGQISVTPNRLVWR
jgi:hypothetical protein